MLEHGLLVGTRTLEQGEVAFGFGGETDVLHSRPNDSVGFGRVVHADEAASETGGLYQCTPAASVAVHDRIARIGRCEYDSFQHGGVLLCGIDGTLRVFVFPDVLGYLALGLVGVVDLARVAGRAPVDEAGVVKF